MTDSFSQRLIAKFALRVSLSNDLKAVEILGSEGKHFQMKVK